MYHPDVFPTLATLAGARIPDEVDGISFLPTLIGGDQQIHPYLYWEYKDQVAVRKGKWKAVRTTRRDRTEWELFDISVDVSETKNLADKHGTVLQELQGYAQEAHEEARPGTFLTRDRLERDREAKWGDMPRPSKNN
jgi:arylsulfatase A-like enzyme